ncbi:hypothetical protein ESY86_07890 [Subsaximicrobium wynnwilliamsii]|uniref:Right-handed parallel beta-helix repeat-containing protein n=1 Tax=Subsaximicrobium wynnwilliamsii TaxID=291179 RepID=A0A5C6ZHP3_9FLAO|nr:hypothetical protein [Subsaximicrobium wynnwilliamsii]TXD89692.1 hypothetical protein ESY86_07890 [Subsaximicrobium wynnwilliamsii]TXE01677.1 hypothetical protein ESY88_14955 [Subsaximicrobium wynnwilliamsii]
MEFKVGDSRRYGIFPDSLNNRLNPKTNKPLLTSLLDCAEKNQFEIEFIEGFYDLNLILDSRKNLSFKFNNSEFKLAHITNEKGARSEHINFKGKLILSDSFGSYYSDHITVDSLIIKTSTRKSLEGRKSRGCHIYKGTNNLHINYLKIQNLASGSEVYENNHAALAIDGLRENPTYITIDEAIIESSDRHGVYITGSQNSIKKLKINSYGQGTTVYMSGMQDSDRGEERVLSGLWINRCNDCQFDEVEIHTKNSKGFPLKLDEGDASRPTFIKLLKMDVPYKDELILDDILTNVLVKKIELVD